MLDAEIQNAYAYYHGVGTRASSQRNRPDGSAEEQLQWLQSITAWLDSANTVISARLCFLLDLRFLMSDYCVVAFAIGFEVRECMWNARTLHSSRNAKEVLQWTLSF